MKTYKAMYRCRLCGKAFYNGRTTGEQQAELHLFDLAALGAPPNKTMPLLLEKHDCGRPFHCLGLADFVGWDPVGKE